MKIKEIIRVSISERMKSEFESAYIYLGMAAWFESTPYSGFTKWMRCQAKEEIEHGMKFFNYLANRNSQIDLPAIPSVLCSYASPLAAFEEALKHEIKITASIHNLYALALKEHDYETQEMLLWFIKEQTEEEHTVSDIIDKIKSINNRPENMLIVDSIVEEMANKD
ncbi:MAG: ferritin [Puniceicoccales bacterium]|jgi:ferritin|nr:ferritin [Puniceicoccales bacterium]